MLLATDYKKWVLPLMLATSLLLSWVINHHAGYVTSDSFDYLWGAVHYYAGHGYLDPSGVAPQVYYPPMYSILIAALLPIISDPFAAGQIVSALASMLSILILNILMRRWFSWKAALAGSFLFLFMPFRIYVSQFIMTEACQTLFILLMLYFYMKSTERRIFIPLTGVMIGIAYLLRDENTIYLMLICGHILFFRKESLWKRIGAILSVGLFAGIVAFSWPLYLKKTTGQWRATTKFDLTWQTGINIYKYNLILGQMLDETGMKVVNPPHEQDNLYDGTKRYAHNFKQEIQKIVYHSGNRFIAGILLTLGLYGLFCRLKPPERGAEAESIKIDTSSFDRCDERWKHERWLLAVFYLVPLVMIYPVFHIYDRFLAPHLPFCAILLFLGLRELKKRIKSLSPTAARNVTIFILFLLSASYFLRLSLTVKEAYGVEFEKSMSDWILSEHREHSKIMKVLPQEIYFRTGAEQILLPIDASLDQALRYAKANQVDYWVISTTDLMTPATTAVIKQNEQKAEMRLLRGFSEGDQEIRIYELNWV